MENTLLGKESLQNLGKNVSSFFSSLTDKKKPAGSTTIIMTRQQSITAVVVGIISCIAMLVYGYVTYQKNITINNKAEELINFKQYNIAFNQ
jgi:ABC-type methionine transport system permease subunit